MQLKVLVVEDQFVEANDLRLMLQKLGHQVCGIARTAAEGLAIYHKEKPDIVLLDIFLKGNQTGIELARQLKPEGVVIIYISANSNEEVLKQAKTTQPDGFLVKPYREYDLVVSLEVAWYRHQHSIETRLAKENDLTKQSGETGGHTGAHKPVFSRAADQHLFDDIVGASNSLLNVFEQVRDVAPLDTSVLLLGESGTGKEKIADLIHRLSPRHDKPFVKVNCAAMPHLLIESSLFGHEKGAFTGAVERRIGKFETAHSGTIFLDEIGEMPLDLQVKLLRVLQEKEVERVGGKDPIKLNVRIIAATNRDLEREVAEGKFRLDLYYRLNIFPVEIPPLRERKADIPALVNYFADQFGKKAGKTITGISERALQQLLAYSWPGNIRELQNVVERSVVLSKDPMIQEFHLPRSYEDSASRKTDATKSIEENEREHIEAVLRQCNGKIWGKGGAAEVLQIPPTTLNSKMKKLGIKKTLD